MSRNEITGELIASRSTNQDVYAKGWDLIFAAKEVQEISVAAFNERMDKEAECCGGCTGCSGNH